MLDKGSFVVNSSLRVAESRLFPVGTPDLIPSHSNLISPFDVATFGKQLLPLINVNIKEKVKDLARTFNSGADYIEDAIRESWRESPLNPHNFKHLLEAPNLFKHLPLAPHPNSLRRPVSSKAPHKEKAPKAIEQYSVDGLMHDYGINGYKHFEESILRELEKQEELKVEATLHTLFEQGDRVQIVQGKPYDFKTGWKPVAAPTKIYDDTSNIHSQIMSPLHTSIFSSQQAPSSAPHDISSGFHDFENLNGNTIHSTYSVHEEEGESKVKPVKTKIRKFTPSSSNHFTTSPTENSRLNSRYRKRHNSNIVKTAGLENFSVPDSGTSGSHDAPKVATKSKRHPQRHHHIQSLTTAKPKLYVTPSRIIVTEAPRLEASAESLSKVPQSFYNESPSRYRPTAVTTTAKPAKKVAPREAVKFVDKPKVTGKRGSIKFGHTTTSKPI